MRNPPSFQKYGFRWVPGSRQIGPKWVPGVKGSDGFGVPGRKPKSELSLRCRVLTHFTFNPFCALNQFFSVIRYNLYS